jgi:basic amino acid/polyamine antiporter, APA family
MLMELSKPGLSFKDFLAIALGSIIGVGWIAVAPSWVAQAGVWDAALAFIAASVTLLPVAYSYAQLASIYPNNGGVLTYVNNLYGWHAGFFASCLVLVSFITATMYFALLLPSLTLESLRLVGYHGELQIYSNFLGFVAVVTVTLILAIVNYYGSHVSARVQMIALICLFGGCAIFVSYGLTLGSAVSVANMKPLASDRVSGFLSVFIVAPWFLSGFEAIAQVVGEKSSSMKARNIVYVIFIAVFAACLFYIAIIAATGFLSLNAPMLEKDRTLLDLIKISAPNKFISMVILLTGLLGLLTSWNAFLLSLLRVFEIMSQKHYISSVFQRSSDGRSSKWSLVILSAFPLGACFFGADSLSPVLDAGSLSVVLTFLIISLCFHKTCKINNNHNYNRQFSKMILSLISVFTAAIFVIIVALVPIWQNSALPAQWWALIMIFLLMIIYFYSIRHNGIFLESS